MGYYMAGGEAAPPDGTPEHPWDLPPPRRMNKWNGRALGRSMTRIKRFVKMARKAVNYAHTAKLRKRRR